MGKSGSGRNPAGLGVSKLRDRLVPGTSLAAGVYGDVKEVKLADLENLRRNYFHPENLIITVAGSVPAEEAANMVDRAFRSRAMQPIMRPDKFDAQERHLRNANLPTRDTLTLGRPQGAVVMGCMIREVTMQDRAALTIANAWFSDQMGMVLREQRGLAYSLGSSLSFQRGDKESLWGLWEISMGTRPEKLIEAETGIDELLNALTTHTFTLEEISRIRAVIAGRMLMRDMSRIGQAFAMGTGQLYWNDPESRAHLLDALNGLTPEEVTAAAQKFMKPGDLSRVIVK
jgi:predicted Zn-dependent peptidase